MLSLSLINDDTVLSEVNTADGLKTAIEHLELKIQEKDAVINIRGLPMVLGNEAYLSQLFLNLIGNSLKFSKDRPVINITGEGKGERALIHISYNGIGMREQDLDNIFGAFQRLNSKAEYEGTGIGLAICNRIVDIHNGTISVSSKVGEGTTFTIELPAAT